MAEKTIVEQVAQEVLDLLASRGDLKKEVEGLEKESQVLGKEINDRIARLDRVNKSIDAAVETKTNADKETVGSVKEAAKAKSECRKAWSDERDAVKKDFDAYRSEKNSKKRKLAKEVKDAEELLAEIKTNISNIQQKVA